MFFFLLKKHFTFNNDRYHHRQQRRQQSISIPYNQYNISRLFFTILLIITNLAQLIHDLCYYQPFWQLININNNNVDNIILASSADISASLLNIITFVSLFLILFLFDWLFENLIIFLPR
mgnify:CR=1 FL=1